jgi:iron complex outermembrane receptor protein
MRSTLLLALAAASPAFAQSGPNAAAPAPDDQASRSATSSHSAAPQDVIVTAPLQQSERDVLQGASVLRGEALTRDLKPTIGETLQHLPGVSATSFGPNASRPILRGQQGERIRVLTDGVGSFDASNTSVDHAVVIDPLLAERIEVLRGPSALLFGSSAIGGVVNVIDRRIPRAVPDSGIALSGLLNYGSAADERSASAAADVAVTSNLVLHADGSYLKADDIRIGGFALSPAARAAARSQIGLPQDVEPGEDPIDFAASANLRGRLPNTAVETWTAGAGAALITEGGSLGVSYSRYDSLYGVPIRYATEVGQEEEAPRIDIVQDRVDLRGDVLTGGDLLERIRVRVGHAQYRHVELEPSGEVGTTFLNNGTEGRLEVIQARRGAWQGATGLQFFNRLFDVDGDEAFVPRSETNQTGVFTLQQLDLGRLKAEGGLRYEWSQLRSRGDAEDLRFFQGKRSFGAFSASLGASYALSDNVRVGLNGSRTSRAPSAEELFANGPHAGTQSYELGDPDFRVERSWGLEGTLHIHGDRFNIDASAYANWFNNYISLNQVDQETCEAAAAPSGREADLPCFQFQQLGDARYYGFEIDASATLFQLGGTRINADVLADYVRASIDAVGPAPRIPPLRLLGGIEVQNTRFTARAEVERVFEQTRIAPFETATPGYTLVNASIVLRPFADSRTHLVLSANNIGDVTARRHASFLKDFAPLAGRDFRATLRFGL